MNICHHVLTLVRVNPNKLTSAKQVISRRRKNENVCEMSKNENCTCKACKSIVFHCQICKFVTFLLPSSSWLRKLPNNSITFQDSITYQLRLEIARKGRPSETLRIAPNTEESSTQKLTSSHSGFVRFAETFFHLHEPPSPLPPQTTASSSNCKTHPNQVIPMKQTKQDKDKYIY